VTIKAIRVQDIKLHKWFSWDKPGPWTPSLPKATVGTKTLYIAFYMENTGVLMRWFVLQVKDDVGTTLATKEVNLYPGQGAGIEAPNLDMPNRAYAITLLDGSEEISFTIQPLSEQEYTAETISSTVYNFMQLMLPLMFLMIIMSMIPAMMTKKEEGE
jgi:hypothetical protein